MGGDVQEPGGVADAAGTPQADRPRPPEAGAPPAAAAEGTAPVPRSRPNRRKALTGAAVVTLALAGAGVAIWRERHSVGPALSHMGAASLLLATLCGLVGVAAAYPVWWTVLAGLDVRLPLASGAGIFFTTQLGKYIPGSVWPMVMQMEAGRDRGASRRTMITGNLMMILISCTSGLVVAAAILPFYDPGALAHYWWGLLFVPALIALLHPRALTGVVDLAARILRRPAEGAALEWHMEVRAFAWSLVAWVAFGLEAAVLIAAVHRWSFSGFAVGLGAMALALPLGILFVPAPAGAGVRDVVLVLVLGSILPTGQALAVVLASRVIAVASDVLAAALAAGVMRWHGRRTRSRAAVPPAAFPATGRLREEQP